MKDICKFLLIFLAFLVAIPAIALIFPPESADNYKRREKEQETAVTTEGTIPLQETAVPIIGETETVTETTAEYQLNKDNNFKVLICKSGQVVEMPMEEYIIGSVLAEMPASYDDEALKAQAVAVHTYAVRQMKKQLSCPDKSLNGAYISDDSSKYQAFFTESDAREFFGDTYEKYYRKVSDCVKQVSSEILVYDGEPIVAAFHSTSNGRTESALVEWGNDVDYLVPVDSPYDITSPDYKNVSKFTSSQINKIFTDMYSDIIFTYNKESWFRILNKSDSGTVMEIEAGNKILSGTEFRKVLGLKSATFSISYEREEDCFIIETKGYGHGVGLSQYGANQMALNGADYKYILAYYYKGAELMKDEFY